MKIIETTVCEEQDGDTYVSLTLADSSKIESAEEWIEIRMKSQVEDNPLFAEVQGEALERARTLIGQQIGRLKSDVAGSR